jgi:hypothetical protein
MINGHKVEALAGETNTLPLATRGDYRIKGWF